MTNSQTQLADDLIALGYQDLFMRLDDAAINSIWTRPDASAALASLVLDARAPAQARFLAAEILFSKDESYPPGPAIPALAQIYATALAENGTGMANPWGLPEELDGAVGQHVVQLGDGAVPALVALLDNATRLQYGGSKEATFGNSYEYRVKDVAAFLISQITGLDYTVQMTPADRDAEIETLKSNLP